MANFMLTSNPHRKTESRRAMQARGTPSTTEVRSNAVMHDEIAERARTSREVNAVTKVDASMSREEIIAKIMGSNRVVQR